MTSLRFSADAFLPEKVLIGNRDKVGLRDALREHSVQFNQAAEDLFHDNRFQPKSEAREIGIRARSVLDLGFPAGATYEQLLEQASAVGLAECPLELGPYLRLQTLDQPAISVEGTPTKGKAPLGAITIASMPICESEETPKGFYLRQVDGTLWLRGYWSGVDHVWSPEDVLVFAVNNEVL